MKKNLIFVTSTLILMAVIFFCFSATAYSQSLERAALGDKEGIDLQEQEILTGIKGVMKEFGCEYSGVTMTKVYCEDGSRNYQVLIHHRDLSYLDAEEMAQLKESLDQVTSGWEHVEFHYEFTFSS